MFDFPLNKSQVLVVFRPNKSQGSVLFRPDFRHLSVKKFKPEMSERTSLAKYEIQEGLFNPKIVS